MDSSIMQDLAKITSLTGWPEIRKSLETSFSSTLQMPSYENVDLQIRIAEENEVRGLTRRQIVFTLTETELAMAWLFLPEGREDVPGILCCHHETPYGKDECAGLEGNSRMAFAQHYAELGYVTLAMDMPTVNRRASSKREPYDTTAFYRENRKTSFAGKTLADHRRALDIFSEVKRVDPTRIGVIGHGIGGLNALLLSACDDRVQACVASCGFTRFATDKNAGIWPHIENTVLYPEIKKCASDKTFPFDWEHILALAAPTPLQIITSLSNSVHDNPKSCQKAVSSAAKIYKLLGAPGAIDHFTHHDGHVVAPETIEVADDWFERWL